MGKYSILADQLREKCFAELVVTCSWAVPLCVFLAAIASFFWSALKWSDPHYALILSTTLSLIALLLSLTGVLRLLETRTAYRNHVRHTLTDSGLLLMLLNKELSNKSRTFKKLGRKSTYHSVLALLLNWHTVVSETGLKANTKRAASLGFWFVALGLVAVLVLPLLTTIEYFFVSPTTDSFLNAGVCMVWVPVTAIILAVWVALISLVETIIRLRITAEIIEGQ